MLITNLQPAAESNCTVKSVVLPNLLQVVKRINQHTVQQTRQPARRVISIVRQIASSQQSSTVTRG